MKDYHINVFYSEGAEKGTGTNGISLRMSWPKIGKMRRLGPFPSFPGGQKRGRGTGTFILAGRRKGDGHVY